MMKEIHVVKADSDEQRANAARTRREMAIYDVEHGTGHFSGPGCPSKRRTRLASRLDAINSIEGSRRLLIMSPSCPPRR